MSLRPRKRGNKLCHLFHLITMLLITSCEHVEKKYYETGELLYEVNTVDGKWHGIKREYYKSGAMLSESNWVHGLRDGEVKFFYETGEVEVVSRFKQGKHCGTADFYSRDGILREKQYYDSLGRQYDFVKFLKDGTQSNNPRARLPLILAKNDTIDHDEVYVATVRLGNRVFQKTKAYLSRKLPPELMKERALPNLDSVTSILTIKDHKEGLNIVEGMIIEINTNYPDSVLVIPFSKTYYVRSFSKRI